MEDKIIKMKEHFSEIMKLLDIKVTPSNKDTPLRLAKMYHNELFLNRNNNNIDELRDGLTVFPNEYESDLIIIKDIPFCSTCEHHFLPFNGLVTVGYVPNQVVIGLSKVPRVVKFFSKKPQLQEQITTEIGEFLFYELEPHAIFVEVTAKHQCVMCRGAESDCETKTIYKKVNSGFENMYDEFKIRALGGK